MAKYALSTKDQGASAHILLPAFIPNNGPAVGGTSFLEIEFALHAMADNGIGYIAGHSGTSAQGLSLTAAFEPRIVIGTTVRVIGPANTGALDRRDTIRLEYDDTGTGTTAQFRLFYNGVPMGSPWTGSINQGSVFANVIGRSTTRYNPITVYRVTAGTIASASYDANWDHSTSTGAGTGWTSSNSAEVLSISGQAGATNSWWTDYDTAQPERHVGGTLAALTADFVAGGSFSQRERYTGGSLVALTADVITGGVSNQRQHYSQGVLETLSCDVISAGSVMQRERYTGSSIEQLAALAIAGGVVMQQERYTGGALDVLTAGVITGGAVMQRERYVGGALESLTVDVIAGGSTNSGEYYSSGSLLAVNAQVIAGGVVMQRERYTGAALESLTAGVITGGAVMQRERYTGGALESLTATAITGGAVMQRQQYTGTTIETLSADFITGGFASGGQHQTGGGLVSLVADFVAGGVVVQRQQYIGGAELVISAETIAGGQVNYAQHVTAGTLLPVACDFIVDGQFNQQFNYVGGSVLQLNADFIAGGKVFQAIKKLRHSGHYVWNNQTKKDQQEYVRQSPDSFTGLLYVVRDAAPVTPDPEQWREDALFAQPDVNQRVTEYADPVVCYVLERPRESLPFDLDAAGENLINEHEDYLTVCVDTDVPTGSALEFEDDLGMGETRRSWWYVHHSTSLGTTAAGAVYYLIPLRDFTGVN